MKFLDISYFVSILNSEIASINSFQLFVEDDLRFFFGGDVWVRKSFEF